MKTLFVCQCSDVEHQFIVQYDDEFDDSLIIDVHLCHLSLWKRIKYGINYILGKKSKYGHGNFAEVILNKIQTKELIEVLQKHYVMMNKDLDYN